MHNNARLAPFHTSPWIENANTASFARKLALGRKSSGRSFLELKQPESSNMLLAMAKSACLDDFFFFDFSASGTTIHPGSSGLQGSSEFQQLRNGTLHTRVLLWERCSLFPFFLRWTNCFFLLAFFSIFRLLIQWWCFRARRWLKKKTTHDGWWEMNELGQLSALPANARPGDAFGFWALWFLAWDDDDNWWLIDLIVFAARLDEIVKAPCPSMIERGSR
jgi:hypothetical protein